MSAASRQERELNSDREPETVVTIHGPSPQTSDHPCFARMLRLTTLLSEVVGEVPASQTLSACEDGCLHASMTHPSS